MSFQAELCPVINTVTPRAFYWAFAVWNYYDYWQNYSTSKRGYSDFEKNYLKRNDYYFVLANLMTENSDRDYLVGKDNCAIDLANNPIGPYPYNRNYFVSSYGGMQYYMPGCETLGFVTSVDNEGNSLPFAKSTEKKGVPLAVAFEKHIRDTEYFRTYRLNDSPVPRPVLEELGKTLSLDMDGMDECKRLLRDAFFEPIRNTVFDNNELILTKNYLLSFAHQCDFSEISAAQIREILYDRYAPEKEERSALPDNLKSISVAWETVIGRQYFTLCIELIWKYMLTELTSPMDLNTWISTCIDDTKWTICLSDPVERFLMEAELQYQEREQLLAEGAKSAKTVSKNLENALKVLISIYKRFCSREDINSYFLSVGEGISIAELIHLVEDYKQRPISELLIYIMINWAVKRHEAVAFRKMVDGRDGFYIEMIDGKYYLKNIAFADFTGNRMMQLIHVMKDLDMLE